MGQVGKLGEVRLKEHREEVETVYSSLFHSSLSAGGWFLKNNPFPLVWICIWLFIILMYIIGPLLHYGTGEGAKGQLASHSLLDRLIMAEGPWIKMAMCPLVRAWSGRRGSGDPEKRRISLGPELERDSLALKASGSWAQGSRWLGYWRRKDSKLPGSWREVPAPLNSNR